MRITISAAFMLVLPLATAPAQTRTVTGTVTDSSNGKPLSDAVVFVGSQMRGTGTGKDGRFGVEGVGALDAVAVHRSGYVPRVLTELSMSGGTDAGAVSLRKVKTDEDRKAVDAEGLRIHPQLGSFYKRK